MSPRRTPLIIAAIAIAYPLLLRRPILTWGATREEATAALAGDGLIGAPDRVSTRAISIAAPAAAVWPWIVQIGPAPRAGAYTYDWIENLLGLDMHSADRVIEEFQRPQLGERIALGSNEMVVAVLEPERAFGWRSDDGNWLWTFTLQPTEEGTRLISRNSFRLPTIGLRIGMVPMEAGSLFMELKMLAGIKRRAEALHGGGIAPRDPSEHARRC